METNLIENRPHTCWEGGDFPPREIKLMLALTLLPGVGAVSFQRLIECFGSAQGVFGAAAAELSVACPLLKPQTLDAIVAGPNLRDVQHQVEACTRLGVKIVFFRSPAYPAPLLTLAAPPPFLFMAGSWLPEDKKAVAVVGTRYPSSYGARMCREVTMGLAEAGWTIVSGLARGIDTAAHEASIRVRSRTIAVLGSGLDWIYPSENLPLSREVAQNGCVISEFPMGTGPHATHFPRRNRLISALALGTLVVEAGNDSGALITAEYALEQGREVFAVPGAVHSPGTVGPHRLIQEGAHLVGGHADIIRVLEGLNQGVPARRFATTGSGADLGKEFGRELAHGEVDADGTAQVEASAPEKDDLAELENLGLDDNARILLGLIGRKAQPLDAIAEKARQQPGFKDVKAHRLLAGLLELELKGKVKRMPGALFRRS